MRELALLTFQTLDGVMQSPSSPTEDTSGGFDAGGWASPHWDEVMEQVMREALAQPYDILFGRKTYELFAAHFPSATDTPKTKKLNDATKWVVTNTLDRLDWKNSHIVRGDVASEVTRLKKQDGPLLQVHGSAALARALLAHDLVDELRLWTFPVVVGTPGKRLFEPGTPARRFRPIKTEATQHGVVMTFYRREES